MTDKNDIDPTESFNSALSGLSRSSVPLYSQIDRKSLYVTLERL